jgi:hypothetical protein
MICRFINESAGNWHRCCFKLRETLVYVRLGYAGVIEPDRKRASTDTQRCDRIERGSADNVAVFVESLTVLLLYLEFPFFR